MKKSITVDSDLAMWVAARLQKTNRSLAGAQSAIPELQKYAKVKSQVQQWGMIVEDATMIDEHNEEFLCDGTRSIDSITDMRKASGLEVMEYMEQHMPVLRDTVDSLATRADFSGIRIAACLILELKTAILLRKLKAAGAIVGIYCGPDSTDPRVAEQLHREGVTVESSRDRIAERAHEAALYLSDEIQPDIVIGDGASFARLVSFERPELTTNLAGVAEKTTNGARVFQQMQEAGAPTYPVVVVNDSVLKTGFDNARGTGKTCVTTMQRIFGEHAFDGKNVIVIGYGPIGQGLAWRIRAPGAEVTTCDIGPVASLKAVFDGFAIQDIDETLPYADMVASATGVRHTVTLEHMHAMHEGAALVVIGGIANEIALDEAGDLTPQVNRDTVQLDVPDGPTLTLIVGGNDVNYMVGGGNPIEITDLSFVVQTSAVIYLLEHRGTLNYTLIRLNAAIDQRIAANALKARGYRTSHAVEDNGYNWRPTRFAENDRENTDRQPQTRHRTQRSEENTTDNTWPAVDTELIDDMILYSARPIISMTGPIIIDGVAAIHGDRVVHVGKRRWVLKALKQEMTAHGTIHERHWDGVFTPGLINAHTYPQYSGMVQVGQGIYDRFRAWELAFNEVHAGAQKTQSWK